MGCCDSKPKAEPAQPAFSNIAQPNPTDISFGSPRNGIPLVSQPSTQITQQPLPPVPGIGSPVPG